MAVSTRVAFGIFLTLGLGGAFRAQEQALPPDLAAFAEGFTSERPTPPELEVLRSWIEPTEPVKIVGPDPLRRDGRSRRLPDHDAEGSHPPRRRDAGVREGLRGLDPQARLPARGHPAASHHACPHRPRGDDGLFQEAVERRGRRDGPRVRAARVRGEDGLPIRRRAGVLLPGGDGGSPDQGRRGGLARKREDDGASRSGAHERRDDVDHQGRRRREVVRRRVPVLHERQSGLSAGRGSVLPGNRRRLCANRGDARVAEAGHLAARAPGGD